MIDKYIDFISESQIQMLLEANMVFSTDFIFAMQEILNSESNGRLIARKILDYRNVFVDMNDNYLDISDNPAMIKFTPDDKVKPEDILYKVSTTANCIRPGHEIIKRVSKDLDMDFSHCTYLYNSQISEREWKVISDIYDKGAPGIKLYVLQNANNESEYVIVYCDKSSKAFFPSSNLSNKSGEVRMGRFINKFLSAIKVNFTAKEIEDFVNQYQTVVNFRKNAFSKFKIVEGEEIRYWYDVENYANTNGQLGSSCMRGKECSKFFDIYVENPEVCKLLIYTENNKLMGRALLWKTNEGQNFMDRPYTNKDNHIILFESWAKENGYVTLKTKNEHISVDVKPKIYKYYPYLDTLVYYSSDKGVLSSDTSDITQWELDSTVGIGHEW